MNKAEFLRAHPASPMQQENDISVKDAAASWGVSETHAWRKLDKLVKLGALEKHYGKLINSKNVGAFYRIVVK